MVTLNPSFLEKDGKRAFAVLSYEEFLQVEEALQDYIDLQELRRAVTAEKDEPTMTLADLKRALETG